MTSLKKCVGSGPKVAIEAGTQTALLHVHGYIKVSLNRDVLLSFSEKFIIIRWVVQSQTK
jgi:hypothetical protein